ncbi:patatin-like phospholipase family protein [Myxococcota bacterium]|nr:patatin-like phospholipase family protein [Myxococcota bacterium]
MPTPVLVRPGEPSPLDVEVELRRGADARPRPSEHPLLAGAALAPARQALEQAFGPPIDIDAVGQVIDGKVGGEPCLLFIVEGNVRLVHLRLERREGGGSPWSRGRDPRVVDLLGPGCFLGLPEAWAHLGGGGAADPPVAEDGVEIRHVGYANPRISTEAPAGTQVVLRALPWRKLAALFQAWPALLPWFEQLQALGSTDRAAAVALLDASPLLAGMGRAEQNAVLQCAMRLEVAPAADTCVDPCLLRAGQAAVRVPLLVGGEVELRQAGADGRVVALAAIGDLLMGGVLADPDGAAPTWPLDAVAGAGAALLCWDRRQLQRILRRSPAAWERLRIFADPQRVQPTRSLARLTVLVADDRAPDSAVVAAGLGLALAREEDEADRLCEITDPRRVLLVDLAGGAAVAAALGVPGELVAGRTEYGDDEQALPPHHELAPTDPSGPLWGLRVLVPDRFADIAALVEGARAQGDVHDVVVHLPRPDQVLPALRPPPGLKVLRHDPEAIRQGWQGRADPRLVVIDCLRSVPLTVVWLNTDPDGWWLFTDEAPTRLVRVDRLSADFVARARQRSATFTQWEVPQHDVRDDRPGTMPSHLVRVPDDVAAFARAARGGTPRALERGRVLPRPRVGPQGRLDPVDRDPVGEAAWRLSRMVRRRCVGVALGGGGTWGAAHIGVLEALEEAGVPIDYVAGTSFGALVGSIYAGGGLQALYRFLDLSTLRPRGPLGRALLRLSERLPTDLRYLVQQAQAGDNAVVRVMWRSQFGSVRALGRLAERAIQGQAVPLGELPMSLAELPTPFVPASSDLSNHRVYEPWWLDLQVAVRAAGSLPPAFPGLKILGSRMVDGAPLANVPAQVLRQRGCDYVLAVNVVGAPYRKRQPRPPGATVRPVSSGMVGRLVDTNILAWLAMWKAGTDQARLAADALVDLRVKDVPLPATWMGPGVAQKAGALVRGEDLGRKVLAQWRAGGRGKGPVLEVRGEVGGEEGQG